MTVEQLCVEMVWIECTHTHADMYLYKLYTGVQEINRKEKKNEKSSICVCFKIEN